MTTETKPDALTPELRAKAVERLREADAKRKGDRQRGEQKGRDWAIHRAEPAALRRLGRLECVGAVAFALRGDTPAFDLWQMLCPDDQDSLAPWLDATFGVTQASVLNADEVLGFVHGALTVWRDVARDV